METTVGDDCVMMPVDGSILAVTADFGPKPLLCQLTGYEDDFEAAGWLAVVVSASDIAAAGARPLCMTNCIDAPSDFRIDDLVRYVRGYFKACAELRFRNGGGDLRCGPSLAIRVAAIGVCQHGVRIGRGGVEAGDQLMVVGPAGRFMATYLLAAGRLAGDVGSSGGLDPHVEEVLRFPRPRLDEMAALAEAHVVVAASDTSDGLLGAIHNLARASRCGFDLALDHALLPEVVQDAARYGGLDPWNVFFAWGDWSVAVAVPVRHLALFRAICEDQDIQYTPLGNATDSAGRIAARRDGGSLVGVEVIRNENFASHGFSGGLEGHLEYLLKARLFE